jgi:class 3 adenylate cyclase
MAITARSAAPSAFDGHAPQRALVRLPYAAQPPSRPAPPALDAGLLALVVTDLEGFTPLVERLGDRAAREVMHAHNRIVRGALRAHGGREVAHTGDGLMVAFRSVACALQAAIDIQRALGAYSRERPAAPLHARIGVHAGEPLPEDGRLFGACVNAAVRVCAATRPRHVLVTDLVRQLAAGKDFGFEPAGALALKGIAQPVHVHELIWAAESAGKCANRLA